LEDLENYSLLHSKICIKSYIRPEKASVLSQPLTRKDYLFRSFLDFVMYDSIFYDFETDQRILQLAFDLFHLNKALYGDAWTPTGAGKYLHSTFVPLEKICDKESLNNSECVSVRNSRVVAEIVGKGGYKVKALSAMTNTFIKVPAPSEEPVFTVFGGKEDIAHAKNEILQASEHFYRKRSGVTVSLYVPYCLVGVVMGHDGENIKRIQRRTDTLIVSPSKNKEPVFKVTGLPDRVEAAKNEIEVHIAFCTGLKGVPFEC